MCGSTCVLQEIQHNSGCSSNCIICSDCALCGKVVCFCCHNLSRFTWTNLFSVWFNKIFSLQSKMNPHWVSFSVLSWMQALFLVTDIKRRHHTGNRTALHMYVIDFLLSEVIFFRFQLHNWSFPAHGTTISLCYIHCRLNLALFFLTWQHRG